MAGEAGGQRVWIKTLIVVYLLLYAAFMTLWVISPSLALMLMSDAMGQLIHGAAWVLNLL